MKTRALSEILWEAANEHLSCDSSIDFRGWDESHFTCDAIRYSVGVYDAARRVIRILETFGLPSDAYDRDDIFGEFDAGEERQGVRYMWLLLAMQAAEDEGIRVEVA